ncbi:MAG: lactonase family protein [Bacteroidales bacterium]|nr:lactonase family protein [Bacteroidales bacterium]
MKAKSFLHITILVIITLFIGSCRPESPVKIHFYVGSYAEAEDTGIYYCELDTVSGEINILSTLSGIKNPSFLTLYPAENQLFAVGEVTKKTAGQASGTVWSIALDPKTGSMEIQNSVSSGGAHPCHVSIDATAHYLLVANYSGGNLAMIPINADMQLGEPVGVYQHEGSGPVAGRQDTPHVHSVNISPDNSMAYACDLGTDQIVAYKINIDEACLTPDSSASYTTAPGAGPRHFAFSPDGKRAFAINELNSTLISFTIDSEGALHEVQTIPTLPDGYTGVSYCADVHVHLNGRFVYGSNRGHNSIVVFALEPSGRLILLQHQPVLGDWPRNFAISPSGKFLLVANRRSDNIVVFKIDQNSGMLSETGHQLSMSQPVCIDFNF